jgi:uncharacterized membrane protein YkvA (DUF1232 family)
MRNVYLNFFEKVKIKSKELKYNLSALTLVYKRKDVSILPKIIIVITIWYALSPIDLIPDFVPVFGYLDDLLILPLLINLALKLIPKEVMDECREQAKNLWKHGKPKRWYYSIFIITIWIFILFIIVKIFLK